MDALIKSRIPELQSICSQHYVAALYLFGSSARGNFDAHNSDIDFVVEFKKDLPLLLSADNYFSLIESLEQLFGRPVDLLWSDAVKNPVLKEEIEKSKLPLYSAA